jgi:hypothetical protein
MKGRNRLYYRSHTDYCHGLGFLVGTWMGWKQMDSIFLGVILFPQPPLF